MTVRNGVSNVNGVMVDAKSVKTPLPRRGVEMCLPKW